MSGRGSLADRVALVTGAGGGIGAAVAAAFCREGARVVLADRDREACERAASSVGEGASAFGVDVAEEDAVRELFERFRDRDLLPDIVVNAAGVLGGDTLHNASRATMDPIFSVNVYGSVFTMKHAAPEMIRRGRGKIVNIASVAISHPNEALSYSASKHAVVGITQTAAVTLAPHGIQVNVIAPGQVDTPMWRGAVDYQRAAFASQGRDPDEFMAGIVGAIPLGRIASPQDISSVVMFLASPASDYMTGQTLGINGGGAM